MVVSRVEAIVMIVWVCLDRRAVAAMTGHEEGSEYGRRAFRCVVVISSVSGLDGGRGAVREGHL